MRFLALGAPIAAVLAALLSGELPFGGACAPGRLFSCQLLCGRMFFGI